MKIVVSKSQIFIVLVAFFIGRTAFADIVTNQGPITISSATTYSGQTNIIEYISGFSNVDADWLITNHTYLRFVGTADNKVADLGIDFAANISAGHDIAVTIDDKSALFCCYRNSTSPAAWAATGIDPPNGTQINANIHLRIGKKGGAKDSTGSAKFIVKTTPSDFGGNVTGAALWSEFLEIESSVKANADGYVDFLQVDKGGVADIGQIINYNTYHPARILFNGGTLRNSYMSIHSNGNVQFSPTTNTVLICEGVNGNPVQILKQYTSDMRINGGMGTLRFQGNCDVKIGESGQILPGMSGTVNRRPHYIDPERGPIEWNQTGDIVIYSNGILLIKADNQLPYGENEPGVRLQSTAILDVNGYTLNLRKLVSESSSAMVTNQTAGVSGRSVVSTIVFGTGDTDGIFSAKCCDNVNIEKVGTGTLIVSNATVKGTLTIKEGRVLFAGKNDFAKNVVIEDGVEVLADVVKSTDAIKSIDYTMPRHTGNPRIRYCKEGANEMLMYPGSVWNGLSVDVKDGTLRFSNVVKDKYWCFTMKTAYQNFTEIGQTTGVVDAAQIEINNIGLWATNVIKASRSLTDSIAYGITTNLASYSMDSPAQLPVGICMPMPKGMSWQLGVNGRTWSGPEVLFDNRASWCWNITKHPNAANGVPKLYDSNTWITVAFRLKDNALPVSSYLPARTHWSSGVAAWILSSSPNGKDGTWTVRHEHMAKWVNTVGLSLDEADRISEYPHCDDNNPKTGASQKDSLKWYNNGVPYHFDQGGGAGETFENIAAEVSKGATLDTNYIGDNYLSFSSLEIDMVAGGGKITKFAPAESGVLRLKNLPIGMNFRNIRDLPITVDKFVRSANLANWVVYLDGVPQKGVRIVIVNGVMRLRHSYGFYLNFR